MPFCAALALVLVSPCAVLGVSAVWVQDLGLLVQSGVGVVWARCGCGDFGLVQF